MEATRLTNQLIDEARSLGRAEKLRLLQILVDELSADDAAHETIAPFGKAPAVEALTGMLRKVEEPVKRKIG